jgi:mannose-1-phosphate guanylyltransferase/mannose-6-phosphate isomerase
MSYSTNYPQIIPVVLSGGSGTRLWPLSRQQHPKQFLPLINEYTLFQNTLRRLDGYQHMADPIVLCNETHRFMVAEQLQQMNCRSSGIILEPVGRNTAPAVAVAALHALTIDADPILLILPADHHIKNIAELHAALNTGIHLAQQDHVITFGIVPTSPETGYGYIQKGALIDRLSAKEGIGYTIARFVEKPDLDTARHYLATGKYFWNSGMFMFKANQILAEMNKFASDIVAACKDAYAKCEMDLDFIRLDNEAFSASPINSIDYAVMEHTAKGAMIPLAAGWSDLGSWQSLWQEGEKDPNGNVISGDVIVSNVHDTYLRASHRLLAVTGLDQYIVVETPDAVFVAPRDQVQNVKQIVRHLQAADRREVRVHRRAYRPWGWAEEVTEGNQFQVKRITLNPGASISLQKHDHRAEHWVIVRGTADVVKGHETFTLKKNESTYIPPGVLHQLKNPGTIPLDLIEIRTGSDLRESDVKRVDRIE